MIILYICKIDEKDKTLSLCMCGDFSFNSNVYLFFCYTINHFVQNLNLQVSIHILEHIFHACTIRHAGIRVK